MTKREVLKSVGLWLVIVISLCTVLFISGCSGGGSSETSEPDPNGIGQYLVPAEGVDTEEETVVDEVVKEEILIDPTELTVFESTEGHIRIIIHYESEAQRQRVMVMYGRYISEFSSRTDSTWWQRKCFENDCFGVD